MARVKDLWLTADGRKTAKHPASGGNSDAKRWQAVWTDPDGNEKTRTFYKKTDATAHGRKMEADAERGEYIDPKAGNELVGPLARKHLRLLKIGASTRQLYEINLRRHVEPEFAHRPVKGVKPSEIVEWLRGPLSSYSASVQQTAFFLLRGAFDLAVADKLRRDNPARSPIVQPPDSADRAPRVLWDAATVWKVVDEHPEPYRAIPVCEAGLGARQGCAFALAEEDIDFDAMTVAIGRQVVRVKGKDYFKLPKYGKVRTVPMSNGVAAFLRWHMERYPPRPYTLAWLKEDGKVAAEPHTCRLLFRWHSDDPRTSDKHIVTVNYDKTVWYPALSRAGVGPAAAATGRRYKSPGRANGSHILRHFFETTLDNGGVSLAGMMEFMGHSRKAQPITIGVYSHVTDETFEHARQAVDSTLFKLRPVESGGTVTELRAAR
jgi:integrase